MCAHDVTSMDNNQSEASSDTSAEFQQAALRFHDRTLVELQALQKKGIGVATAIEPLRKRVQFREHSAVSIIRFSITQPGKRRGAFKEPDTTALLGVATIEYPTVGNDNERMTPMLCLYRHSKECDAEPTILMRFDPVASPLDDDDWRRTIREHAMALADSMR